MNLTFLQSQLSIKADTSEMVANGVLAVLGKLSEETGKILGGEWEVEEGGARVPRWHCLSMM